VRGKRRIKVILDTNIWTYLAQSKAFDKLVSQAYLNSIDIVVPPTVVTELRAIGNASLRRVALEGVTREQWSRSMSEAYSECMEIKSEIARLRPHWLVANPNYVEFNRLRYDWIRRKGGFWERARNETEDRVTDESVRADRELLLARKQSYEIRGRLKDEKQQLDVDLSDVGWQPDASEPGYRGFPVHYWRAQSLVHYSRELMYYTSPYREWLDNEIDVFSMLSDRASMNSLWWYEMDPARIPRQWLRSAFEFLQCWKRVTDGTPGDSSLASYLVEAEFVVSADKNLCLFANKCNEQAPFKCARAIRVSGGESGVNELFQIFHELNITMQRV